MGGARRWAGTVGHWEWLSAEMKITRKRLEAVASGKATL